MSGAADEQLAEAGVGGGREEYKTGVDVFLRFGEIFVCWTLFIGAIIVYAIRRWRWRARDAEAREKLLGARDAVDVFGVREFLDGQSGIVSRE